MGACVSCGKGLCLDCLNKVDGKIYCHLCLPTGSGSLDSSLARLEQTIERQSVIVKQQITTVATHKRREIAAILAILLGGFGGHKFYLGEYGWGILYFLFSWTGIPTLAGWVEGIVYLVRSEEDFIRRFGQPTSHIQLNSAPRRNVLNTKISGFRNNSRLSEPQKPRDYERLLLDFARKNQGEISVARLMSEHEVNLDKVEDAIARLSAKGLVENNIDDQGRIIYFVPEFLDSDY